MNHLIQARPLFGRREAGSAERTGRQCRNRAGAAPPEPGHLALGEQKVLGELHMDQLGREVEHERRIELAAMGRSGRVFEIVGEVEGKDVHGEYSSPPRAQRGEGFLMGIMSVGGKNNESVHATLLPGAEQVVHPAVQSFPAHRRIAREGTLGGGVHAIRYRRGAQDAEAARQVVGETLDDERVAAEREVWSMLLAGANGYQQP